MASKGQVRSYFKIVRRPRQGHLGMKHKRKRRKSLHNDVASELNHSAQVLLEKQGSENASSADWRTESSESVSSDSQESLRKILGTRKFQNLQDKFNFQDSDDSDEEEEQSIKGDPTEQETYKSTMQGIRETLMKPVS